MTAPCPFCTLPRDRILHERETAFAIRDGFPVSPGHTLIIPKEPAETLDKLSDDSAAALGRIMPRICRAVLKATGATAYNVLQNNGPAAHQAVMHVHFHIIPTMGEAGLGIGWKAGKLEDGPKLATQIAANL